MKTKLEALRVLEECDHLFLSKEGVLEITKPFGFSGRTYTAKANPEEFKGLTLPDGLTSMEGQDAHKVAMQICDHLKLKYPEMYGMGSQLRACCHAIWQFLKRE